MKTPDEILRENITYYSSDTFNTVFRKEVIKAMKLYANQKIDEAAEIAVDHGDIKIRNKIISLKYKI